MNRALSSTASAAASRSLRVADAGGFPLVELRGGSPLGIQVLANGTVFALRHRDTLLNRSLPGPCEEGLCRLLIRWSGPDGASGWAPVAGAGLGFAAAPGSSAAWRSRPGGGLACVTTLEVHPERAAWKWLVRLSNESAGLRRVELLHAQDLGLADEGYLRNNEAFASHYIDLLPVEDPALGWVVLCRQNRAMAAGRHPWAAFACAAGAAGCCTDGVQFFGADHRLTCRPAAVDAPRLPSKALQGELALAGLQSRPIEVPPGGTAELSVVGIFEADHGEASSAADLARVRAALAGGWPDALPGPAGRTETGSASVFVSAGWLHGDRPGEADLAAWFPGPRRHEERSPAGDLLSFFHGEDAHVATRDKEAGLARPHGHLLRSGEPAWPDAAQWGLTAYASGIFSAQAYYANPSLGRLLSVVRDSLNLGRAAGQRVFVRGEGAWRQLGVPSAFAMTPGDARWVYRFGARTLEARVWCSRRLSASFLELRAEGAPCEFLVSHQLALGGNEFELPGEMECLSEQGWIACRPAPESALRREFPDACFAIAAAGPEDLAALGGGELLAGGEAGPWPYACLRSGAAWRFGVVLVGSDGGRHGLEAAVAEARREWGMRPEGSRARPAPVRLACAPEPGAARLDEALPWLSHNAGIHFSAPHGLEQASGGAWGVRDVCQGSMEWLLSSGDFGAAKRVLLTVFGRQHPDGSWPQWFMLPPFLSIQDRHSHGDVCLWPLKALCDYVEASGDFEVLAEEADYADSRRFAPVGRLEPLGAHCDRILAHCESRFVPGTALLNYGEGDWDDTLQPADPSMRTRMVSPWTVALAYHALRQWREICRRGNDPARTARAGSLLGRIRKDFEERLMPAGVVAGFAVAEPDGRFRPLLHPEDRTIGIRYRLLPMTRGVLAELFTPEEARRHFQIIGRHLSFADGVRLMSEPAEYHGGLERFFKRGDTAAYFGREVGLQYMHAHLRYAEALAKLGEAGKLWAALQVVNPVGLERVLPKTEPRQSNAYFSSSDACFSTRREASERWDELREGEVAVRGGWRIYSSGPGIFLRIVRTCLLGIRESFGDVVFDPVLPGNLDGLTASASVCGRAATVTYRIGDRSSGPVSVVVNGARLDEAVRDGNPYRLGGLRVAGALLRSRLRSEGNSIAVIL